MYIVLQNSVKLIKWICYNNKSTRERMCGTAETVYEHDIGWTQSLTENTGYFASFWFSEILFWVFNV